MSGALATLSVTGTDDLKLATHRLQLATKKFGRDFLLWRSAIICKDFIQFLAPRGAHPGSEGSNDQKERGWRNVKDDIKKVFRSGHDLFDILKLHPLVQKNPKLSTILSNYITAKDYANLSNVLKKIGSRVVLLPTPTRPLHFAERNPQNGRVFKRAHKTYYTLDDSKVQGYVVEIQKDVGKLKSGCMKAANKLKSLGAEVHGIPLWVRRHNEPGAFVDESNNPSGDASFTIINQAKGVERFKDILPDIQATNERKMLIEAQKKLPALLRKYGTTSRMIYGI